MSLWLQGFLVGVLTATVVIIGIAAGIGGAVLRARASPKPKSPPRKECQGCGGTGTSIFHGIIGDRPCVDCGGTGRL